MSIVDQVRSELKKLEKPENMVDAQRFFKEKLKNPKSLKTPIVRAVARDLFKRIKSHPKAEILDWCEQLFEAEFMGSSGVALFWAARLEKQYKQSDFARFERWLKGYVHNWAYCDGLSCYVLGPLLMMYPALLPRVNKWAKSGNLWLRRAAAVTLIPPVRAGLMLDSVFATADVLLEDTEDLVQKGYGWMLKEAANRYPDEVFNYVLEHKAAMPRTALRYAIEKMPPQRRRRAMSHD